MFLGHKSSERIYKKCIRKPQTFDPIFIRVKQQLKQLKFTSWMLWSTEWNKNKFWILSSREKIEMPTLRDG